jgi:MSHA biogenesis protein MshK
MNRLTNLAAMAASALLAIGGAQAQSMSDPTRPPGAAAMQGGPDEIPAGRQLQSILFSGGRKLAIIDGASVPLGGTLGDARVVRITETEVTLKRGAETEVLKLYPGVDKQPVKRAASRSPGAAAASKPSRNGGSE